MSDMTKTIIIFFVTIATIYNVAIQKIYNFYKLMYFSMVYENYPFTTFTT